MAITFTTAPTGITQPAIGSVYFDQNTSTFKMYDGSTWQYVSMGFHETMERQLITDELTFGSLTFYTVEPKGYDWDELHNWCQETFGPPRDGIKIQETLHNKWFTSGGSFHFHEEKHRDWFMIKWSSE